MREREQLKHVIIGLVAAVAVKAMRDWRPPAAVRMGSIQREMER